MERQSRRSWPARGGGAGADHWLCYSHAQVSQGFSSKDKGLVRLVAQLEHAEDKGVAACAAVVTQGQPQAPSSPPIPTQLQSSASDNTSNTVQALLRVWAQYCKVPALWASHQPHGNPGSPGGPHQPHGDMQVVPSRTHQHVALGQHPLPSSTTSWG